MHRIFSYDECSAEDQVQQCKEYRECQPAVGHHGIYLVCDGGTAASLSLIWFIGLGQGSLNECIFGIHHRRFQTRSKDLSDTVVLLKPGRYDLVPVFKLLHDLLHLLVILQILDGKVTCRVLVSYDIILLKQQLDAVYALLNLRSMIDMDVTGDVRVCLLIDLYHGVEKLFYSCSRPADCRYERHTQQVAELLDVQLIPPRLHLVIHVQSHHDTKVHVDELGSEVEVSLEVGRIDNIHDHIRHPLDEILSDIKLLRTIC